MYRRGPMAGGASKASPSTRCQKCLKTGHYSYECKAVVQERPYVSRPSRTQQMLNPKLVPKLTSEVSQGILQKKGIADQQLAKAELERGRKRERQSEDPESRKRIRSASSASVTTISTRSPSPPADRRKSISISESPQRRPKSTSLSPRPSHQRLPDSEKKRRRESYSSVDSYSSTERRASRERRSSRSTRRRFQQASPPVRGRKATESRSPFRERRKLSNDRQRDGHRGRDSFGDTVMSSSNRPPPPRERSLSPFSKRLALTQAMNMGQ
ncbi:uncharacterized protein PAC_10262 [Phialocephala subalpina]|uniref:Uncharacterized protein n=1 Tax=Phialocephala subalpina TaxID=576137 RepID=A0A1L7X5Q6_9HELO|nr:uncharacterized protein PAC_10262 [Phialocephala subalpina]